jgi:hypothetical protein
MEGEQPTYRSLWLRIRDHLPKKGRKTEELDEQPRLPAECAFVVRFGEVFRATSKAARPFQNEGSILLVSQRRVSGSGRVLTTSRRPVP